MNRKNDDCAINEHKKMLNCIKENVFIFDPLLGIPYKDREFPDIRPILDYDQVDQTHFDLCKRYMIEFYMALYQNWYYKILLEFDGSMIQTFRIPFTPIMSVSQMWREFQREWGHQIQIPDRRMCCDVIQCPITNDDFIRTMTEVDCIMRIRGRRFYTEVVSNISTK
jgi:hypothetical protein